MRAGRGVPALAALALACPAAGCGADAGAPASDGRLRVVTTVAPITSIAASIGGDRVSITGVVPEGTNSHTFEPKPSVAELLSQADVVYVNGLGLEEPTHRLAEQNLKAGAGVVELGPASITRSRYIYDATFPRSGGRPNPHLWTDPSYALRYARAIRDDLRRRDRANAAAYDANLARFETEVRALDGAMRTAFSTIPRARRKLLTYHDAYAYFGRSYGWDVIGAIQLSDFEDPTPKDVARLIGQVRAEAVPAIFGSEVFPSPVLAQIGREAGVAYVDTLRDDDLPGEPGDAQHSWLGLMRQDCITLTEAMAGDAAALRALRPASGATDRASYPQ